ncbi:hypothetical protein GCM10009098_15540 [Rheinheimera aquimaris]|uniref:Uncharacterized protein n=1 Tax=Rheinheimera aquimaris TaxID=412437 RepID=A0ABP3NML3_9GAMM
MIVEEVMGTIQIIQRKRMNTPKAIIVGATILAFSIIISPVLLQKYKMIQCVSAYEQLHKVPSDSSELTCMQYIK